MIKVIASDLDETLLNSEHVVSAGNAAAIKKAQEAGIEFLAITGREYAGAMTVLKPAGIDCNCILASGAEVRDRKGTVEKSILMSDEEVRQVLKIAEPYPVIVFFFSDEWSYLLGTEEDLKNYLLGEVRQFFFNGTEEEILASEIYKERRSYLKRIGSLEEMRRKGIPIVKTFLFSEDTELMKRVKSLYDPLPTIAVASSLPTNIELTDIRAQKGPILKEWIEEHGYSMDEVMVLGDSLNDVSMLQMDYGVTVAVGNAVKEAWEAARYVTKTNNEDGVAYAIEKVLAGQIEDLAK